MAERALQDHITHPISEDRVFVRDARAYVDVLRDLMAATTATLAASRPYPMLPRLMPPEATPVKTPGAKAAAAKPQLDHFTRLLVEGLRKSPPAEQRAQIQKLATEHWLSEASLMELCALPASVSQPLLHQARLTDASLFNLLNNQSEDHQIAIAGRPCLSNNLVKAIINLPPFAVHLSLLNNPTARFEPEDIQALCQLAQTYGALRAALVRHPLFSESHAKMLMASVGPHLRESLLVRFPYLSPPKTGLTTAQALSDLNLTSLTNGLLLNLLHIGQFDAFLQGVARKLEVDADKLRASLNGKSCVSLALTLAALGIDRAAFADVLQQIQRLNHQNPKVTSAHHLLARPVFDLPAAQAQQKLQAILG